MSIFRVPEHPLVLFTTDSLVLYCVIELIPEVDSHVTISSQWSGHSSLTDSARRVIIADLEGTQLTYNTSVTFNTLKSSDSGSYVCSATVGQQSESMSGSPLNEETITISIGMSLNHTASTSMYNHLHSTFSTEGHYWSIIQSSI